MNPQPIYRGKQVAPNYRLHYSWTAWPSCEPFPNVDAEAVLNELRPLWEQDGLRVLDHFWSADKIHATFSATPSVSPVTLAARAKGRLQHTLRTRFGRPVVFSRKVSVRSIGENIRRHVEVYIAKQVDSAQFVDPRFEQQMHEYTVVRPDVDFSRPTASARGRYWYNLHLVLVVAGRFRIVDSERLSIIRDWSFKIADTKGYAISRLSVMPDHLHVALRGCIDHSPFDIALAFQNNLAYALGQSPIWDDGFYVGTFSEYDMWAIRRHAKTAKPRT